MISLPLAIVWAGAALLAPLDGRRRLAGWLAFALLAGALLGLLRLAATVLDGGPVEELTGGWPAGVGIRLRADGLGVTFAVVSTVLLATVLLHELLSGVRERAFPVLVLFLAAGLNGLFLTGDAFNFYVFFEVAMTSSFVLATYGQEKRQLRDAFTFTAVNLLGSVILLAAVAALYRLTGTLDMPAIAAWAGETRPGAAVLIAVLLLTAFGLKLGLFPFHFWLPPVYQGTHAAVAAILAGIIANIGGYGLLRFGAGLLERELRAGAPVLLLLGGASILYGALVALTRRDASEMLAYSSISQAGYILLALALGGAAGYAAAVLYAVLNGLNKTLLFLAAGQRGPAVGAAFAVGALSVAGVPPAAGFLGKAALFRAGIAGESLVVLLLVGLGSLLSLLYAFQVYQRVSWDGQGGETSSLGPRLLVLCLAGAVLLLGAWPEPLLALSAWAAVPLSGGGP